jgi:D-inositol-3-phosphate glycosyltransferase
VRVALISEHASPLAALGSVYAGGQNAHVADLSAALARQGHQVRVYTRRDSRDLPPLVRTADGVEVVHVPAGPPEAVDRDHLLAHMKEFSRGLAGEWQEGWRPHVAHAHFWMSGLAAVWAGARCGVPVVQTYHALGTVKRRHQGMADRSPPGRIRSEQLLGRAAHRVVAQCRDEVAELVAMGVPRSRITLIPSGVDAGRFRPGRGRAARGEHPVRILAVGRLVERKGFDDLVRAMAMVPEAEAVVVGGRPAAGLADDPVARRLRELARENDVDGRVRLVGAVPREQMPDWYRSADVLACPPWYEPFGLTPLEAMACGLPVVAAAVGGLTDTVVDGTTGVLVRPRDPEALAAALRTLVADPHLRFRYGAAGRARVRRRYSWHRTAAELAALYADVAGVSRAWSSAATVAVG